MENKYLDYEGFEHTIERLRRKEMPEPGLDYVGQIVQYVGVSDGTYQKGCFYECISEIDETTGDPVYSWKMLEYNSKSVYNQAIEYGYRDNTESDMFATIMSSAGGLANTMLGEIKGMKFEVGPGNTPKQSEVSWVTDAMSVDPSTGYVYWIGPKPISSGSFNKYLIYLHQLNGETGEITSVDLELNNGTTGSIFDDGGNVSARDIAFYENYAYLAIRSIKTSHPSSINDKIGAFIVVNTSTMTVVHTEILPGRCSGVSVHEHGSGASKVVYFVLNARNEFAKFGIIGNDGIPTWFKSIYFKLFPSGQVPPGDTYMNTIFEHQKGGCFYEDEENNRILYIVAGFGDFYIWDLTALEASTTEAGDKAALIYSFTFVEHPDIIPTYNDGTVHSQNHTLSCVLNYPYVYCSLAPAEKMRADDETNGTNLRRMGVLTFDISDIEGVKASVQYIAVDDMCNNKDQFDTMPNRIRMFEDKLFLGNGDRGVSVFDISTPSKPVYLGTKLITDVNSVDALDIIDKYLVVGDCGSVDKNKYGKNDLVYLTPKYIKVYEIYKNYNSLFAGGLVPPEDGYGALIDVEIMEDFKKYSSDTSVDFTTMTGNDYAAKLQAAIDTGKTVLVPHGTYDLNHVQIKFPMNRIAEVIGENAHNCIFENCNFVAPNGLSLKNLTLFGGTVRTLTDKGYGNDAEIIVFATPRTATSEISYENCIFKTTLDQTGENRGKSYASFAGLRENVGSVYTHKIYDDDSSASSLTVAPILTDTVRNCVFENIGNGVYHEVPIAKGRYFNNTFKDIGFISDPKYLEVTVPSEASGWVPVEMGLFEVVSGEYVLSKDKSIVSGKQYYYANTHNTVALKSGETSNITSNKVEDCVIKGNLFDTMYTNTWMDAEAHVDECNFVTVHATRVIITENKFKDLLGYAHDREGIYTKSVHADISYNYIENGGLGEGYICCKKMDTAKDGANIMLDRSINIHDNVLNGKYGRGIILYGNGCIKNNTIMISDSRGGIVASEGAPTDEGTESHQITDNNIVVGISNLVIDGTNVDEYSARASLARQYHYKPMNGYREKLAGDPQSKGYYEIVSGNYVLTSDTSQATRSGVFNKNSVYKVYYRLENDGVNPYDKQWCEVINGYITPTDDTSYVEDKVYYSKPSPGTSAIFVSGGVNEDIRGNDIKFKVNIVDTNSYWYNSYRREADRKDFFTGFKCIYAVVAKDILRISDNHIVTLWNKPGTDVKNNIWGVYFQAPSNPYSAGLDIFVENNIIDAPEAPIELDVVNIPSIPVKMTVVNNFVGHPSEISYKSTNKGFELIAADSSPASDLHTLIFDTKQRNISFNGSGKYVYMRSNAYIPNVEIPDISWINI